MSLKAIHIVFVTAALLLTAFFGVWAWRGYAGPESTQAETQRITEGMAKA